MECDVSICEEIHWVLTKEKFPSMKTQIQDQVIWSAPGISTDSELTFYERKLSKKRFEKVTCKKTSSSSSGKGIRTTTRQTDGGPGHDPAQEHSHPGSERRFIFGTTLKRDVKFMPKHPSRPTHGSRALGPPFSSYGSVAVSYCGVMIMIP